MPFSFRKKLPGVYAKELPSFRPPISGISTAITAFVGWSPTGPVDQAVRIGNFGDYGTIFGGLHTDSFLGFAVSQFFDNGGREAYIIRLADGAAPLFPNDDVFRTRLLEPGGGVHLLDDVDLFNLLCVPGLTETADVAQLQSFCAVRRAFLIVDCPADATVASLQSGVPSGLGGSKAMNAAVYFPWVEAPDPLNHFLPRTFPPSGFIAGIYSRTDGTRGVWKAPAGRNASLNGVTGPALALSSPQVRLLNPQAVNCIREFPGYGTLCVGARTLHGQASRGSEWRYVSVRRTALFIEESLERGLRWTVFEPNDENLWTQIRASVDLFLNNLYRKGAFPGNSAKEAWFVRCDRSTTTQSDINHGIVNLLIGFALLKPAEFVVLKLTLKAQ